MHTKIFEVVFSHSASPCLDEAEPFFINNLNPGWRELQAYAEIYRHQEYKSADFVGVFSPKFTLKSKISVKDFRKFVQNYPKSDVIFINPFPQIAYRSLNTWMQGELAHPGLVNLAKDLLVKVGLNNLNLMEKRQGPDILCYCNFWVGTPKFWDDYVGGVLMPIVEFIEGSFGFDLASKVTSDTNHTEQAPFLPFIIERLFSTFLQSRPDIVATSWKHCVGDIVDKYCLNEFERILVRGIATEIDLLDAKGRESFSLDIRRRMLMNSMLSQQHHNDFYSFVPHPHSGYPIRRDPSNTNSV
jgi:hypothetical protein